MLLNVSCRALERQDWLRTDSLLRHKPSRAQLKQEPTTIKESHQVIRQVIRVIAQPCPSQQHQLLNVLLTTRITQTLHQ